MKSILKLFSKNNPPASPYSDALSMAFKEMFIEMGYRFDGQKNNGPMHINDSRMLPEEVKTLQLTQPRLVG